MDDLLEEFWDWFRDAFQTKNPDETPSWEYKTLFKIFWEDKFHDAWNEVKGECQNFHESIYEPDDPDYDME